MAPQTCFLTGTPGESLSKLAALLESEGIRVQVPWNSPSTADTTMAQAVKQSMAAVDCVVVQWADSCPPFVLFELGVAVGQAKPVLIIQEGQSEIPLPLRELPFVRSSPSDKDLVRQGIHQFLRNADITPSNPKRSVEPNEVSVSDRLGLQDRLAEVRAAHSIDRARLMEDLVGLILQTVSDTFDRAPKHRNQGHTVRPDFVAWLRDGKGLCIGPVVVEVKAGDSTSRLQEWIWTTTKSAQIIGSVAAIILVYLGSPQPNTGVFEQVTSPFLVYELGEFLTAALDQTLVDQVRRARNMFAHG